MTKSAAATDSGLDQLPRWVPPVLFAVLTAIVFRNYLLSPPGSMLLGQDTLAAGIMFRGFFVEQYHELHRLPLWNPYLFGGVPTIEAGSGDILYPPAWLHFILPLTSALAWKLILHVFLAGLFMYAAARAFGTSRWVALLAGSSYLLSANLVTLVWGGQDGKMYVISLFPAALCLLVSGLRTGSGIRFVWFGVVCGLMAIAHPQLAYYAYLTLGIYALVGVFALRREGSAALLRRLGWGLLSLVLALGVAAITLLPMSRYLREESPRAGGGLSYEKAASYSLHPEEMVNLLIPDFSGVRDTYWGRNPLKHNIEYGGVVILALAVAGLIALRGDRRRVGLGLMAGLALLYALGDTTPAFRLMYLVIPGLRNFRAPSLVMFVAFSALAVLAGLVLERVFADRDGREGRVTTRVLAWLAGLCAVLGLALATGGVGALGVWTAIFGPPLQPAALQANLPAMSRGALLAALWCGLAAGALVGWRRGVLSPRAVVAVLLAVVTIDQLRVDAPFIETVRYDDYFAPDAGIDRLRESLGPGERVLAFSGTFPTDGHLAVYRIPLVFGYHGNQIRRYDELTRRTQRESPATQEAAQRYWLDLLNGPVLRLLATRVVILPGKIDLPGYELMGGNDRIAVYRNPRALAGATVVPGIVVEPDSSRVVDRLWDPAFDPAAQVIVGRPITGLTGGGKGTATISADSADQVRIEAATDGPSMLLVSRNWHPSWVATLDGAPVTVERVDHSLIGIPLASPGRHEVLLSYRPAIVTLAMRLSLAGWLAAFLLTGLLALMQRRASASA